MLPKHFLGEIIQIEVFGVPNVYNFNNVPIMMRDILTMNYLLRIVYGTKNDNDDITDNEHMKNNNNSHHIHIIYI